MAIHIPFPQAELFQVFDLCAQGTLTWRKRPCDPYFNRRYAGNEAGSVLKSGYRRVHVGGLILYSHRIVFYMANGTQPGMLDHINGDKLDNRPANLRVTCHTTNLRNHKLSKANKSGVSGVFENAGKKGSTCAAMISGKRLGTFKTFEEAVAVRRQAEKVLGYGGVVNF